MQSIASNCETIPNCEKIPNFETIPNCEKIVQSSIFSDEDNKKINDLTLIIFGGVGYIGSLVSNFFVGSKIKKIISIDNLCEEKSLRRVRTLLGKDNYEQFQYDIIKDKEAIEELIENEEPDAILYLAQSSSKFKLTYDPDLYLQELNKFKIAIEMAGICESKFIYASSIDVYEPFSGPKSNIYTLLSKNFELMAKTYSEFYNITTVGLRLADVYGPDQKYKMKNSENEYEMPIIPQIIKKALKNKEIVLWSPRKLYNPCFVEDCALAIAKFIIGENNENSVCDICDDTMYISESALAKLVKILCNSTSNVSYALGENYPLYDDDELKIVKENDYKFPDDEDIYSPKFSDDSSLIDDDINNILKMNYIAGDTMSCVEKIGFYPNTNIINGLMATIDFYRKTLEFKRNIKSQIKEQIRSD